MKKLLPFLLISMLSIMEMYGQEFKISADLRARYEHRQGFGTLRPADNNLDKAANLIYQRARLNMYHFNKAKTLRFGFQVQDVRTWGATPQLNIGDSNNLSLHQGWGEIFFSPYSSLKIGRQELNYDDFRILGNVDWLMQARSHDLALYKYESDKFQLHIGAATNAVGNTNFKEPYTINNYKAMQFLWFHKNFDPFKLSVLLLNNGVEIQRTQNPTPEDLATIYGTTIGGRGQYTSDFLDAFVNFYYQGGKDKIERKFRAYNFLAEVFIKGGDNWKLLVATEVLSGTDSEFNPQGEIIGTEDKNKSFNPLYGTNHKFNGLMDYFYVGNHIDNVGLNDFYGGFIAKEGNWGANAIVHFFRADAKVLIPNGEQLDNYLGTEIDLTGSYKYTDDVTFQGGFSAMFASETMELIKNGDKGKFNHWAWVMVMIKPTFFYKKAEQK